MPDTVFRHREGQRMPVFNIEVETELDPEYLVRLIEALPAKVVRLESRGSPLEIRPSAGRRRGLPRTGGG